jgi:hypothetical protein
MADQTAGTAGAANDLLTASRDLTQRVRDAQRGTWFPLLLFAAVTFIAVIVDRLGYRHVTLTCRSIELDGEPGRVCSAYPTWTFIYWPIALTLSYVAIAWFSIRRARNRGIGTRIQPYVVAGIVLALLLTAISLWAAHHPSTPNDLLGWHQHAGSGASAFLLRLEGPTAAIGLALLVLAWVDRDPALLVFTLGYLAVVLVPITFGWSLGRPSPWVFVPHLVIAGTVLLLGGIGFAIGRRPAG